MIFITSLNFAFNISAGENICITEFLESDSIYAGFYGATQKQTRPQVELEITGPGWFGEQPGVLYKNQSFNISIKYGGEYKFCFKAKNITGHSLERSVWFQNEHDYTHIKVQNHQNRSLSIKQQNAELFDEVKRQQKFYTELQNVESNVFLQMFVCTIISLIILFGIVNIQYNWLKGEIKKRL